MSKKPYLPDYDLSCKDESDSEKINRLIQVVNGCQQVFDNDWKGHYIDLCNHYDPQAAPDLTIEGSNRNKHQPDRGKKNTSSEPTTKLEILANGLFAGICNPADKWFKFVPENVRTGTTSTKTENVYYEAMTDYMASLMRKSGFQAKIASALYDYVLFGTSAMIIEKGIDYGFRYVLLPCGSYYIDTVNDEPTTLVRKLYYSANELVSIFDEGKISENIKNLVGKQFEKQFLVYQIMMPRKMYDPAKKDSLNKPYASYYMLQGDSNNSVSAQPTLLKESGYSHKPFIAPRYKVVTGGTYGRGPASVALPEVKTLYSLEKVLMTSISKAASPPLAVDSSVKSIKNVKTSPNGITFQPNMALNGGAGIVPIGDYRSAYQESDVYRRDKSMNIDHALYNDVITPLLARDKTKSATEAQGLMDEAIGRISPVIMQTTVECMTPALEIMYDLIVSNNADDENMPIPPASLEGKEMKVQYTSPLALSAEKRELESMNRLAMFAGQLAQSGKPEVLSHVDAVGMVRKYAHILTQDDMMVDEKEANGQNEAMKKQAEGQAMQSQITDQIIPAAKTASEISPDSQIGQMIGNMQPPANGGGNGQQ